MRLNLQLFGGRGANVGKVTEVGKGKVSNAEGEAIEWYVSGDGMWINDYMRKDAEAAEEQYGSLSDNEKRYIELLDKVTNNKVTDETLYRAVDMSAIFGDMGQFDKFDVINALSYQPKGKYETERLDAIKNKLNRALGKTIVDKGFLSTTKDENIAREWNGYTGSENDIVIKIINAKGAKGKDVSKATKYLSQVEKENPQKEVLLARNTSYTPKKYYMKNGVLYVDVELKKG